MLLVPLIYSKRYLLTAAFVAGGIVLSGQDLYLVMPDYNHIAIPPVRLAKIAGVSTVNTDNTTLDEQHQRFFFLANATLPGPANLYTLDAVAGNVLSSPVCPSNVANASVFGLHFDIATDNLYAVCTFNLYPLTTPYSSFCWIEPSTGIVHLISAYPRPLDEPTTFDQQGHRYMAVYDSVVTLNVSTAVANLVRLASFYGYMQYYNQGQTLLGIPLARLGVSLSPSALYPDRPGLG